MKALFTATLVGVLSFIPVSVSAQPKIPFCVWGETPIRQIDDLTIVCRNLNPKRSYPKAIDEVSLYRWRSQKDLGDSTSVLVYPGGLKLANIGEHQDCIKNGSATICTQTIQFWLIGRRFDEWTEISKADPQMLERHRSDLSLLLDTLETNPLVKPEF
ncbi:hypothetical protein ACQ4M3_23495 [Leptolyngbya sp. AN03gr2]|uniref:hypothetical protein n=1 Tax=unclassified Leptolyngbya TaxID=2650499 RepID=UPI003D3201FF